MLTAAHGACGSLSPASTYTHSAITFAPGYDNEPDTRFGGVWGVERIDVAPGYVANGDEEDDYAILVIAPKDGVRIQDVTGGLRLTTAHLPEKVAVVGYNDLEYDPEGNVPIVCQALAFAETDDSETWARFDCQNYQDGTSGGPWIAHGGEVVGVIGGYEQGGDSPDWSYSALFNGADTLAFYRSVVGSR